MNKKIKKYFKKVNDFKRSNKFPASVAVLGGLIVIGVPGVMTLLVVFGLLNVIFDSLKQLFFSKKKKGAVNESA